MGRVCSKCRQEKTDADYSSQSSGYCKPCMNNYQRERTAKRRAYKLAHPRPRGWKPRYKPEDKHVLRIYLKNYDKRNGKWKAQHDLKVCKVCLRRGDEEGMIFRSLAMHRCHDCMRKGLHRCNRCNRVKRTKFMTNRRGRCKACEEIRRVHRLALAQQRLLTRSVRAVRGDGTCVQCGEKVPKDPLGYPTLVGHDCTQDGHDG